MGVVSAIIIGFLLGPMYGTISAIIGALLGVIFFNIGGVVGPIVPVVATASSAFVAGAIRTRRPVLVPLLYVIGMALFLASPIGLLAYPYLWLHSVALVCAFLFIIPATRAWLYARLHVNPERPENSLVPILILSFAAVMADHLLGGAVGAWWFTAILGWDVIGTAVAYIGLIFIYPLERLAVIAVTTAVALALARALDKAGLVIPGLWPHEEARIAEN